MSPSISIVGVSLTWSERLPVNSRLVAVLGCFSCSVFSKLCVCVYVYHLYPCVRQIVGPLQRRIQRRSKWLLPGPTEKTSYLPIPCISPAGSILQRPSLLPPPACLSLTTTSTRLLESCNMRATSSCKQTTWTTSTMSSEFVVVLFCVCFIVAVIWWLTATRNSLCFSWECGMILSSQSTSWNTSTQLMVYI